MLAATYIIYIILALLAALAAIAKKLTIVGSLTGFIVGVFVFEGGGLAALAELAAFFITGTLATSIGSANKKALRIAEENKGRRTAGQVLANGSVATLAGVFFLICPAQPIFIALLMAGSLAAATADTLSSELGNVYGRRFYNIVTFKKDTRGLDGVVSLEGTLAGIAGAAIIAIIYFAFTGYVLLAIFVLAAGVFGTLIDSLLGATLERRGWLTNNWVNFLNTLSGAVVAGLLYIVFK